LPAAAGSLQSASRVAQFAFESDIVTFGDLITRGDWTTVERQAHCAERTHRTAFGAATSLTATVANWRDRCGP
jgi:hypothetical protein